MMDSCLRRNDKSKIIYETMYSVPGFNIFILALVFGLLETVVRHIFPRQYFGIGIPLMRRNYEVEFVEYLPTDFANIFGTVEVVGLLPQVEIKKLAKVEYGLWANRMRSSGNWPRRRSRYNPVTRGYLFLDKEKLRVGMHVYLNWFVTPFLFAWFSFILLGPLSAFNIIFSIGGIFIFGMLIRGEIRQYLKAWNVVTRYVQGEYEADDIAVHLIKLNNKSSENHF